MRFPNRGPLVASFVLLILLGAALLWRRSVNHQWLSRTRRIQPGDSQERVLSLIGSPSSTETGLLTWLHCGSYERWCYSSRLPFAFEPSSEFPWIVRCTLFDFDTNAVYVSFDYLGRVSRVSVPQQ